VDSHDRLWQLAVGVKETLDKLDITSVMSKHAEYRRGGFGSRSIPEGSRSSETPCPVTQHVTARDAAGVPTGWSPVTSGDRTDREAHRHARAYVRYLEQMAYAARSLLIEQNWFLETAKPLPDEAPTPCSNLACPDGFLEDGRKRRASAASVGSGVRGMGWSGRNNGKAQHDPSRSDR
jgi:hypothetical protein